MKRREKIKHLHEIADSVLNTPYQVGVNDCNLLVIRVVDLFCGTDYFSKAKYTTIKEGLRIFKDNGFDDLEDLVSKQGQQTDFPIIGDIMIDNLNASVVLNDIVLSVNHETKRFEVKRLSDFKDKVFYRIG